MKTIEGYGARKHLQNWNYMLLQLVCVVISLLKSELQCWKLATDRGWRTEQGLD
jgi:hypothetical protein